MKFLKNIYLPLFVLAGVLASCSPDADNIAPTASLSQDAKGKPTANASEKVSLSLTFNPATAIVGQSVAVTSIATPNPLEGELLLQRAVDANENFTTVALAEDWKTVARVDITASNNSVVHNYTPDAAGMFGFRAHYKPKGGSGYGAAQTTADLEVIQPCAERLSLNGNAVATHISGDLYGIEVTYIVAACEDLTDLKLQGGITAHSSFGNTMPTYSASRETGNGNKVITWNETSMMGGASKTYKIMFEKELKNAGTHTVTGGWSVSALDENGNVLKVELDELSVTI